MEKLIGSRRLPYLRLQNVRLRGQLEEEHRHMRLLGKSKRVSCGSRSFAANWRSKKRLDEALEDPKGLRLDLPTLKKWMLDVKVTSVWGQQLRLDAKLQVPDLGKQKKSIILCWCSMSSWCYLQNVFHMSYFFNNLTSLTPARIHRSRVNQFACLHMFFFRFSLGVLGRKPPRQRHLRPW